MRFFSLFLMFMAIAKLQNEVPRFIIDFDLHPSVRYNEVFDHFKDDILKMDTLFLHSIAQSKIDFFKKNID